MAQLLMSYCYTSGVRGGGGGGGREEDGDVGGGGGRVWGGG